MVSADVKQLGIVVGAAVAVGGVAFKAGMSTDMSAATSIALFLLFFIATQYNKQQKPTGFAAEARQQKAAAGDDDDEEEEPVRPKVVKQNKNSKRLARKAKAKAERKKNGPTEEELQRERERAAKEKAARLAKAKAAEPESETSKKNKKKQKAKERKKQIEQMKEQQKELDAGEWEVQASTRPSKPARAAADDADEDGEKKKVVAEATVYEEVDPKFYGRIIGSAGATLNALQDGTGTEITMPRRDANHRMVTIVGSKEGTKLAQQYIKELVTKGYCKLTDPDMTSTIVKVPGKQHMTIVGTGGATIRTLQTATNTRINIPNRDSKSEDIEVLGNAQDVARAVTAIRELVQDGFSSITHEGWIKYPVSLDPAHFRTIIGKGGATIKSIQTTSGCKVNIPPASSVDQKVYICGPLNGVDHAEQLMRKAIAENEAKELAYQQSQIIELDTTGVWAERNYHESDLWA